MLQQVPTSSTSLFQDQSFFHLPSTISIVEPGDLDEQVSLGSINPYIEVSFCFFLPFFLLLLFECWLERVSVCELVVLLGSSFVYFGVDLTYVHTATGVSE